ncbi:DUF1236 domain-containing protein [Rhizobium cauense]|uniref:DUF1236 domain-containing protein n=1 Tax=Rhizobium cauense TaxID=1166683 RepID=UPI001C6E22F3|nr:DUF1236 domain-containing protein [Rhizobium cauense]MBW9115541.1 DUF1236 domain-containing protein [Rhizobium cauense]
MKHHHLAALVAAFSLSVSPLATAPATAQGNTKTQPGSQTETQSGTQVDQSKGASSGSNSDCTPDASGACSKKGQFTEQKTPAADMQKEPNDSSPTSKDASGKSSTEMKTKSGSQDASGGTATEQKSKSGTPDESGDATKQSTDQNKSTSTNKTSTETNVENNTTNNNQTTNGQTTNSQTTNSKTTNSKTNVNVTVEQRTEIRQVIQEVHVEPVKEVDFTVSVGTTIPKRAHLQRLPPRIVKIVPAYEGYRFFLLADGRIVIVDPDALTIVYIIEA